MDTIGKWRLACPLIMVSILGVVRSGYGQPNKSKLPDAKHRDNDIRAIESLPGCLGVRSFEREEGGDVSLIWFKNRKTANALFKSTFHLDTMEQIQQTTRKRKRRKLLKYVPKDTGPILIVVTRMSEDEKGDSTPAQYAVELYTPLSGGLSFGGRFAPKGIKIPKMRRYKNSKKKTNRGAREKSLPRISSETLQRGRKAYQTGMCAKCHRNNATGGPRAPNLTDNTWLHCDGSIEGIRKVLVTGVPRERMKKPDRLFSMNPATKLIPDQKQIDALAAYIWSLGKHKSNPRVIQQDGSPEFP